MLRLRDDLVLIREATSVVERTISRFNTEFPGFSSKTRMHLVSSMKRLVKLLEASAKKKRQEQKDD